METESKQAALREAMASGVFVEFRDAQGNSVGQAVFLDWRGQPLPAVGDTLCAHVAETGTGQKKKLVGRVHSRQFDVQIEAGGGTSVWVHLVASVVDRSSSRAPQPPPRPFRVSFSNN